MMPNRCVVAAGPLEVVQQRPDEVAADVDAGVDRLVHGGEVVAQVRDPVRVVHPAVGADPSGKAAPFSVTISGRSA